MNNFDVLVIGAGPAGLYASFYCGLRSLKTLIVEKSAIVGGQPASLFAQKYVWDFPGQIKITGAEITNQLIKQVESVNQWVKLEKEKEISNFKKTGELFQAEIGGEKYIFKSIIVATGAGLFLPVKIDCPIENSSNIDYQVTSLEKYNDKKVVILGGGDSAIDWANMLIEQGITNKITLIHRRKDFRAKQSNVKKLEESNKCEMLKEYNITKIMNSKIYVTKSENNVENEIEYDYVIVQYGLQVNKSSIIDDLNLKIDEKNKILVDQKQSTNINGVFAIGNSCSYKGKTNVISVSLGEAVNAVTGASFHINPNTSPIFYTTAIKNKN